MEAFLSRMAYHLAGQSWQIAILILVVAFITFLLRDRSAHVRYLLWLVVLAKCLVPPWFAVNLDVLPEDPASPVAAWMSPVGGEHPEQGLAPPEIQGAPSGVSTAQTPVARRHPWSIPARLGLIWLAGLVVYLAINLLRALRAQWWFHRRRRPLPETWKQRIGEILRVGGAKGMPTVWLLDEIGQPFVWGLWRGSIYLPARFLDLEDDQRQRGILLHELGHVVRHDAAVNILQVAAQAIFWFHPFVWWAGRQIRQEREKCCDEMAIARLGLAPKDYGTAILSTLIQARESTRSVPSLAVAGPVKNIEERIRSMLRPGKRFHTRPSLAVATIVLLIALVTVPTALVLTVKAQTPPAPTPAAQPAAGGAGPEQRYPARTFNSALPFDVFVQESTGAELSPGRIGRTPSPSPLEIRPNIIWWVKPTAPVTDWKALLQEVEQNKIPGLMLVPVEDSDTQHLADFRSLKGLWLEGEKLTDAGLAPLEGLTGLEVLRIHKAIIRGPGLTHIEGMTGLEVLRLDLTTDESLSHVKGLTQLQSLAVGFPATDAGLVYLKGLTELRRLGLYGTRVTDAGLVNLKGLSKLEVLNLAFTRITDAGITDLTALSSLSRLFVDHTAVTDAGLARLQTETRLRRLNLIDNKITDKGLANLEPQNELNWLDLSGTQITDDGLAHLKGMSGMLRLHLSRTQITGTGLEHIKGLPRLWQLNLSETRMTDAGLAHLEGMTPLRDLNLSGTQSTDAGLAHLKGLTGLEKLNVSGTKVTDAGVQQLKQSLPKLTITRNP